MTKPLAPATPRRRLIPTVLQLLFAMIVQAAPDKTVYDFQTATNAAAWQVVNDDVMGGVSSSSFCVTNGVALFREGLEPSPAERATYLQKIWGPYHRALQEELARLKAEFGYALLFDAHSIRSVIPHLFDGKLPDFNLGTFNGAACDPQLASQLEAICATHPQYTHVLNGRFKGGHITRHYGDPAQDIHAVQLELCQSAYMEEFEPFRYRPDLAEPTRVVLKQLLEGFLNWGHKHYR